MLAPAKLTNQILELLRSSSRPFLLGVTGAMAVGKTTFSLALKGALEETLGQGTVTLISTDGFLYPNRELARRGLLGHKGSPDSFDGLALLQFLASLRRGDQDVWEIPFYDQTIKDIHATTRQVIPKSDIYLLEGISLLFPFAETGGAYDRLILLDKSERQVYQQFHARFLRAYELSGQSSAYFRDPDWQDEETRESRLDTIWTDIHIPFYERWVVSMRARADWIVSPTFDPNLL